MRRKQGLRESGVSDRTLRLPDRLAMSHLLLTAIALGYRGYGLPLGDLIGEANVGLNQAVRRFIRNLASGSPPTRCGGSGRQSMSTCCTIGRW